MAIVKIIRELQGGFDENGNFIYALRTQLSNPIVVVDDEKETRTLCKTMDGHYYYRKRRNYYTEQEYADRCNSFVDSEHHGKGYDHRADGVSYIFFSWGAEGNIERRIGMKSTEYEKRLSKSNHALHRDAHLEQISRNNEKVKMEKEKGKVVDTVINKVPKVLLFDLETAPMVSYHWRRFKENIGIDQTISESFIICYSAKWLYSAEMMGDCCTPDEMLDRDDKRVCESLWKLIDEADVVVAHNGLKADVLWMNSRFIVNGMMPPSSYIVVDTLQIAKKKFGFSSNKLDALAGYFGIDHKLDTDFGLWRRCMNGDEESLDYMYEYNQKDVEILEDVFVQLRPWAGNLVPNMGRFVDRDVCVICGSDEYELLEGKYYVTPCHKYQLYRCKKCGGLFHSRKPIVTTDNIFNSCAR